MATPLTSRLVPCSFSQHNLRLVDLEHCLLVSVTKFEDKFAILQQAYLQVKCQNMLYKYVFDKITGKFCGICGFCEFHGISWIDLNFMTPWPHEISEALNSPCLSNQLLRIFQSIKLLKIIVLFTWPCLHYNQTIFLVILHLTTVSHNSNLLCHL